ncbi:amino acid ABC transporter permease [Taklimakanibacter deserti]|uniref:amino acid ABC transporter permease n=1 Tax=Taklimakanibacter deserti TaxID=2267839 RepID=UPI000E64F3C7
MSSRGRPGGAPPGLSSFRAWLGQKPLLQLGGLAVLIAFAAYLGHNLISNMDRVGITPGFGFLWRPANFEIGESLIAYSSQMSFGRAILVGALNTLMASFAGCVFATALGLMLGIARLSGNPLLAGLVKAYVEAVRNTPLLLQLFFWSATVQSLPAIRRAFEPLPGVLFSNRGVFLPSLTSATGGWTVALAIFGVILGGCWLLLSHRLKDNPRQRLKGRIMLLLAALAGLVLVAFAGGLTIEWPERKGFNVTGGLSSTPEFAALLFGLAINASAGIAEIVRSGIEAVPNGQAEAARAMGLHQGQILRLIVLPQALRIMIPLLTSNYLSLTKNSSLAVAIGYPDLVSIINTTANQTGQALEAILIMMAIYLSINLTVSLLMNHYHARHALITR